MASRLSACVGLDGLSGFQYVDFLRERVVGEFVNDTLHATATQQSPVLNASVLRRALAKGFNDRSARTTLLFGFDVALACQNFSGTP
jgi:hypothetical protein